MIHARHQRSTLLITMVIAVVTACATTTVAQDVDQEKATKVKCAFLPKLVRFVSWPKNAFPAKDTPITIGVLGKDPFGDDLDDAVEGTTIGNRSYKIVRLDGFDETPTAEGDAESIEKMKACHILFIAKSEEEHAGAILDLLADEPVLTVSDIDDFAESGGMVEFYIKSSGTIGFRINRGESMDASLKISAKLLQLATVVETKP